MNKKKLSLKENALWNTVGTFTYLLLQWLISVCVTRISGFSGAGLYSLAMTVAGVFACICSFNSRTYQVSDITNKFTNQIYITSKISTCILGFIVCALFAIFNRYEIQQTWCILLYMLFKVSEGIVDVFHGIDQKHNRMDIIGKSFIIRGVISFISFIVVLLITKNIMLSIVVMAIATFLCIFIYDIPSSKSLDIVGVSLDFSQIIKLLSICFPLFLSSILMNSMSNIAKYFLEMYHGKEILGIYSSVAMPTLLVQVASTFIFNPLIGSFAISYNNKDKKLFNRIFIRCILAIILITVICEVGVLLFGNIGLKILFGDKILKYSYLLFPMIISTSLTAMVWFLCMILTVIRSFKYMIVANLLGVIVCVGLSLSLVKDYDMNGVNAVTIISQFIEIVILFIIIFIEVKKVFEIKENDYVRKNT